MILAASERVESVIKSHKKCHHLTNFLSMTVRQECKVSEKIQNVPWYRCTYGWM